MWFYITFFLIIENIILWLPFKLSSGVFSLRTLVFGERKCCLGPSSTMLSALEGAVVPDNELRFCPGSARKCSRSKCNKFAGFSRICLAVSPGSVQRLLLLRLIELLKIVMLHR